jgi:hypothetical protein
MSDDDVLLDEKATCRLIGGTKPINPATLWRGIKAGRYSKPISISPNGRRWIRREILADLRTLADERETEAA